MKLKNTITINPPPFTNADGEIVHPEPLIFDELDVAYIDNPTRRFVHAIISNIPSPIVLAQDDTYDSLGEYTSLQIEQVFRDKLGDHPVKTLRALFPKTLEENPNGAGTILSNMLSVIGLKSSSACACRRHAIEMNENGPDWCEQNLDTIIAWLKEESAKRKLPFIESVAKMMVNKAISKAREHIKISNEQKQ
jgi:hypothetical protein